jgi:hypothetical protein
MKCRRRRIRRMREWFRRHCINPFGPVADYPEKLVVLDTFKSLVGMRYKRRSIVMRYVEDQFVAGNVIRVIVFYKSPSWL